MIAYEVASGIAVPLGGGVVAWFGPDSLEAIVRIDSQTGDIKEIEVRGFDLDGVDLRNVPLGRLQAFARWRPVRELIHSTTSIPKPSPNELGEVNVVSTCPEMPPKPRRRGAYRLGWYVLLYDKYQALKVAHWGAARIMAEANGWTPDAVRQWVKQAESAIDEMRQNGVDLDALARAAAGVEQ